MANMAEDTPTQTELPQGDNNPDPNERVIDAPDDDANDMESLLQDRDATIAKLNAERDEAKKAVEALQKERNELKLAYANAEALAGRWIRKGTDFATEIQHVRGLSLDAETGEVKGTAEYVLPRIRTRRAIDVNEGQQQGGGVATQTQTPYAASMNQNGALRP